MYKRASLVQLHMCPCVHAHEWGVRRVGHGHRINSEQDTTTDRQSSFEVARYVLHNVSVQHASEKCFLNCKELPTYV